MPSKLDHYIISTSGDVSHIIPADTPYQLAKKLHVEFVEANEKRGGDIRWQ